MVTPQIGSPITLTHRGRPIDDPDVQKEMEFEIVARELGFGEWLDHKDGIPFVSFCDKPGATAMGEALTFQSLLSFGGDTRITFSAVVAKVWAR